MPGNILTFKAFNRIGQAVAGRIDIGIIDLVGIACQNNFGSLSSPGNNCFDLMRGQILGLVDNHILLGYRTTTNVGERLNFHQPQIDQLTITPFALAALVIGRQQQFNIVKNRLHPWRKLFLNIARQEAEIPAHGKHRPRNKQTIVGTFIRGFQQSGRNGQQSFTGPRLTDQGNQLNIIIEQQVEGKLLFPGCVDGSPRHPPWGF